MISGKDALIAVAEGREVEIWNSFYDKWIPVARCTMTINSFIIGMHKFRLKPRTVNLNGIECGLLVSSQWSQDEPNQVKLEFENSEAARCFGSKALQIFNDKQG